MKRLLYKDEEFFYENYKNQTYDSIGSWLKVYVKTNRWWKRYKCIGGIYDTWRKLVDRDEEIVKIIEEWKVGTNKKPRMIQCSEAIREIYENSP